MCSHYLVDPVACTPASGWEKRQVENQVGLVRERFFTPRLRFKNSRGGFADSGRDDQGIRNLCR
jgi:transposase